MKIVSNAISRNLKIAGLITGGGGLLFFLIFYLIKKVTFTEGSLLPNVVDLTLLEGIALVGCIIGFWHTREAGIILIFTSIIFFLQFIGRHLGLPFGGLLYALPVFLSGGLFLTSHFVSRKLKEKEQHPDQPTMLD
jgi:hypothetical protein